MSAIPPAHRIELSPAVRVILEAESPKSQFLKDFLRYQQALLDPDTAGLDNGVTPDVRCHELEAMGIPPGRKGRKIFRWQAKAGSPTEKIFTTAVRFTVEKSAKPLL